MNYLNHSPINLHLCYMHLIILTAHCHWIVWQNYIFFCRLQNNSIFFMIHPRIALVLSMSPTNLSPPANILSVFENTIRLSADILIASADALIVFVSATNKAATKRKHTPLPSLFFFVVTPSRRHPLSITD